MNIAHANLSGDQIRAIIDFKVNGNESGFILIGDVPVGNVPSTPKNRSAMYKCDSVSESNLLMSAYLLGEPIGYVQESGGELINNFFPHESSANDLTSDSYDAELDLHTENAFHGIMPDFLVLLCLRQDVLKQAITYVSSINKLMGHLSQEDLNFFFCEKYNFLSDYCQFEKNCRIDIGKRQTVLYGDFSSPFFRFDPGFMVAGSRLAQSKLNYLRDLAWKMAVPIKLKAGDLLVIDNRRTSHARSPFHAEFQGRDRWLQRSFVVANRNFIVEKTRANKRVFELMAEI